jgi:type IV secretion system protein TrbB
MADLFSIAAAEEAQGRRRQMLRTAFGPTIAAALADPAVIEVMVNPDGKLWIERASVGRQDTGEHIASTEAERIIRLVAAHVRREVTDKAPIVSAELPETGERFEGVMPPVSPAPCFAVRKPADVLYRLSDYVAARIMSPRQAEALAVAVRERRNILVVGGTSSGKTTLVNALLAEIADLGERVVILEDTRELKCAAVDCVSMRTKPGVATLATWCARRSGYGPTASSLARCADPRHSTCSKPGTPAIPAASPPYTPIRRDPASTGSSSWCKRPSSRCRAISLCRPSMSSCSWRDGASTGVSRPCSSSIISMTTATTCSSPWRGPLCTRFDGRERMRPLAILHSQSCRWVLVPFAGLLIVALTEPAIAAGSGMPWEAPLQRILESIEGPVAKVVAVIIIIVTGLSLAFGDMGGGLRRLIQIVFGLSIAFAATSFFLSFFAFAGGALIN